MERGEFLTTAGRDALNRFPPEVDSGEASRCFCLDSADFADIVNRRYGAAGRLAGGLQIGALQLLGFVPSDLTTAPTEIVRFVADQVNALPEDLAEYTTRHQTRSDHVAAVEKHLGFRRLEQDDLKALADWLVERALEHDRPMVLFRLACEHLRALRLVRPGGRLASLGPSFGPSTVA